MRPGIVFLLILGFALAWVLLKDSAWMAYFNQGEAATAPPPSYEGQDNWAHWPEPAPAPVWEAGWDVDVFLIPPMPAAAHRHGIMAASHPRARHSVVSRAEPLVGALSELGPVYMPLVRAPSPADRAPDWSESRADLAAALDTYLETRNAGRALVIAVPPGSGRLLEAVTRSVAQSQTGLDARLGGVVRFRQEAPKAIPAQLCGQAAEALGCRIDIASRADSGVRKLVLPTLPGGSPLLELAAPDAAQAALRARREELRAWLEANLAKRAEPLDGFETIEVAPVRKPGQAEDEADKPAPAD